MKTEKMIVGAVGIIALVSNIVAEDMTPSKILERVKTTYESMETYKAEGLITSDIDTGGMKMNTRTPFSILLKKPNLYLISWTQENMSMPGRSVPAGNDERWHAAVSPGQSGAVWSDGTQPYLSSCISHINVIFTSAYRDGHIFGLWRTWLMFLHLQCTYSHDSVILLSHNLLK